MKWGLRTLEKTEEEYMNEMDKNEDSSSRYHVRLKLKEETMLKAMMKATELVIVRS
jgi:nucleoside-triphosphatase THEP1